MTLEQLRTKIDEINEQIINLIAVRAELSKHVAIEKNKINKNIEDKEREQELLNKVKTIAEEKKVDPDLIEDIFKKIIEHSKQIQKST